MNYRTLLSVRLHLSSLDLPNEPMKNASSTVTNWRVRRDWSNTSGSVVSNTTISTYTGGRSNSFSFTGFGPNTDPKKKKPVAGTYEIVERRQMYGDIFEYAPWWGNTFSTISYRGNVSGLVADSSHSYCSYIAAGSIHTHQWMNWAYNEALSKLWEKIKQTETNIALTLGEGRETGRMFKAFRSVDKIVSNIRKARKLIKRNPSLLLAQTHLSVKYGWVPLITDVWNYANWTYHMFNFGIPFRVRSRRPIRISESWSDSNGYNLVNGGEWHSCEIGLRCYVNDPTWFTASRLTSFNPASIAWELTTLSFVVDWLYDIGGYLENLENACATGLAFQQGYVTYVAYQECTHSHARKKRTLNGSNQYTTQSGYATSRYKKVVKRRDVLTAFPMPRKPTFKLRMGSGRILSAAALSRTILLGKVR